jgi:hypothetical protein
MDSLKPDLNGTTCSVDDCFDVADVVALAEFEPHPHTGSLAPLQVAIPFCVEHAHLLRMPPTLSAFSNGMD